jgi:hypothetical protein
MGQSEPSLYFISRARALKIWRVTFFAHLLLYVSKRHNAARRPAGQPIEKESVHKLCEKKAMIKLLLFCVSHPFITSLPPLFRRSSAARALPARRDALSVRIQRRWNYENKQRT